MEQRKLKLVDVEMENVELGRPRSNFVEHEHVIGDRIANGCIQAQRSRHTWHEFRSGVTVAAGKQRHVVALRNKLLGQIENYALGSPVELRRHTLNQRGDLGDLHGVSEY